MNLSEIKKYIKIYWISFKFGLVSATAYRLGFVIELLVEFGHNLSFFIFFAVIYANVKEIGGWNYNQILFFTGLNIVTSELILGTIFIDKVWYLPEMIRTGQFDFALIKPLNPLFGLLLPPYFSGLISLIPGLYLMFYSLTKMNWQINPLSIFGGVVIFVCGYLIAYSIGIMISSLSFKFIGTNSFPNFASRLITDLKAYPQGIFQGVTKIIFFYFLPVVFIASVPSKIIFDGFSPMYVLLAIALAIIFLTITFQFWNLMIKQYSSASS